MRIYTLQGLPKNEYKNAGGKAMGLSELMRAGLHVARGFVVIGLDDEQDLEICADYYLKNGYEKVAVRSSATNEDGVDFSNAGQYSTYLDVSGKDAFIDALNGCLNSLNNYTASSYSKFFSQNSERASMSIVVQEMVDAVYAGVGFSADPVTREKKLLIEAVEGLGESLVSGQASAESYSVEIEQDSSGVWSPKFCKDDIGGFLSYDYLSAISKDILKAVSFFGRELDMEWAINSGGTLVWLQARPITTFDEAKCDEFDAKYFEPDSVFTNCNIGEMLPGVVTPLSLSTSVLSIDKGLMAMLINSGTYKKSQIKPGDCIVSFSNQLFFNLSRIYKMAACMIGAKKEDVEMSICGKHLDTPPLKIKNRAKIIRLINGIKYFRYLLSRKKAIKKMDRLVERFEIKYSDDIVEYYKNITAALPTVDRSLYLHYITSSHSGAMSSTLLTILTKEYGDEAEAKSVLAGLLEDIDGIESVDILRSMRAVAKQALLQLGKNKVVADLTPEKVLQMIKDNNGELKAAYEHFIRRHGHRAIREAELRSKSWKADELSLAENILTVMKTGAEEGQKIASNYKACYERVTDGKKRMAKRGINYLITQARAGVYNREYTKSGIIRAIDVLKINYQRLADNLVLCGALPEPDLIYFLTNKEIGELIISKKTKLIKRATQRRRLMNEQASHKYKDVYIGRPEPIGNENIVSENGMTLSGAPISRGHVSGIARIIKTVDDARELKAGEIMVASFTDIGWSPYYSVIGGLITEVGSALSHGAVVAREYALPLVVNVINATSIIKTGDKIMLDANSGLVTILETATA